MGQHHNVFKNSASAIESILALHFPEGTILDVNYGHGIFYKNVTRSVVGVDLKSTGTVVADNRALPFADNTFDIGVLDPPYKRGIGNSRYTERYGVAPCTEPRVTKLYFAALPELLRVCRLGIIVKVQDSSDGHSFHGRHIAICNWMTEHTRLRVHDVAVVARLNIPDANTQGKARYFQQALSYFLIFKWCSKSPFRPVRH